MAARGAVDAGDDGRGALALAHAGVILGAAVVVAEILGATRFRSSWWGAHAWGFFPPGFLWSAVAIVVIAIGLARLRPARFDRWLVGALGMTRGAPEWLGLAIASLVAGVLFWTLRESHTLLGDGNPITQNLPRGQRFHPDEPLTLLLHHEWYRLTRGLFDGAGRRPEEVAHATVGLSSAVCGMLFVPIAWGLARDLVRNGTVALERGSRAWLATGMLVFVVLVAQGYVQLFFGYVENYSFYLLVLAAYALAALRSLSGRAPLVLPAALLVLALALHLSAAIVVPSFAVVVVRHLADRASRGRALRDLALGAALLVTTHVGLGLAEPGYQWFGMLARLGGAATDPSSSYGFHTPNLGQFLNQQVLIGPLGIFLLLPAVLVWLVGRRWRDARILCLLALAAGYGVASFVAGDSNLGVARNWDLLAPAGFVFTLTALAIALRFRWTAPGHRRWLFLLALVSLFHTVPWVAVNASVERALERMKALPLGQGRSQALVGSWYLEHGREREAALWFRRSLEENPMNNLAAYQLGRVAMRHDDHAFAIRAFTAALEARPTMGQYRFALVDALVRSGQRARARVELDTLLARDPGHPAYWAASSILWLDLGQPDRARAALGSIERLAVGDSLLPVLRAHVERDTSAAYLLEHVWPQLVDY